MISNTNKIYFGNQEISQVYIGDILVFGGETAWTPYSLGSSLALWLDATDTDTITLNGSNVSQWDDKSDNQLVVTQSVADQQPAYTTGEKVTFDLVNDTMTVTMPATTGTLVLATANGTAAYGVTIPAGSYSIGGHNIGYMPDGPVIGQIITSTAMSEADKSNAIAWLREKGGGNNYGIVTDFSSFWREWRELTSFPLLDTSSGTDFFAAWLGCTSLTSFPPLDTSSGTNFRAAWYNCTGLTSFPLINTSRVTDFQGAWQYCSSLSSFPLIDTSSGTTFREAWYGCTGLTSFPLIDTSSGTDFEYSWVNCTSLTSFPLLDTSSGTTFRAAWYGCTSLTSFPLLNTSSGTNFRAAWKYCTSLTSFPLLDTSSGTTFREAWYGCTGLTSFPLIDTSSGTDFEYSWVNCTGLTSFPLIDTSSGTTFRSAWYNCSSLTSFPLIDVSSGTSFYFAWFGCTSLVDFPANFFDGCPATEFTNAFTNTNLSQQSIDNILVSIASNGTSNGTFNQSGGHGVSAVGQAAINALRGRGWTVTVTEEWVDPTPASWTPDDLGADLALWLDATDTDTITLNGPNVSQWDDKSDNNRHAIQATATLQPTYDSANDRVVFDKVDDRIVSAMPTTSGTLILATPNGTAAYGVNIPSGNYIIGGHDNGKYMPDNSIIGQIVTNTAMSEDDKSNAIAWLREKGGGNDYGTVTNFTNFWSKWQELTSFPLINTSNGTIFVFAWYNCTGLTSFPLIDTSSGTNFSGAWTGCSSLTSFPLIDTSNGVEFQSAWASCSSLTSFPLIDTSNVTTFYFAWQHCESLTSFPLINTSRVTDFQGAWQYCSSLSSFPLIDTSSGTNFSFAWSHCFSLTSFPLLDTVAGLNFSFGWYKCSSLVDFPANFFDGCPATNFTNAFINTNLSQQSIDNILVSIESNGTSNGTFTQSGGLAPSTTGEAAITALRNRGWSITVTGGF